MLRIYIETYDFTLDKNIDFIKNKFKDFIIKTLLCKNIKEVSMFFENTYLIVENSDIDINIEDSPDIYSELLPNLSIEGFFPWVITEPINDKNQLWLNFGFAIDGDKTCNIGTGVYKKEFTPEIIYLIEQFYKKIGLIYGVYMTISPGESQEGILTKDIEKFLSFEAAFIPNEIINSLNINFEDYTYKYKYKQLNNYYIVLKKEFWVNIKL